MPADRPAAAIPDLGDPGLDTPGRAAPYLAVQRAFTDHLRDPDRHPPPPGLDDRRLAVYRDAVYGNMDEFMGDNFPRLKGCLGPAAWGRLLRDYLAQHRARTPLFPKLAEEFLHYLAAERQEATDPPFAHELAHYDWLESEVNIDPTEVDLAGVDRDGDPVAGVPVVNPVHRLVVFQFPVQRIGPEHQPLAAPPDPTYLLVFRDLENQEGFIELNAVTARLFELARANSEGLGHAGDLPGALPGDRAGRRSGRELLLAVAAELRHPKPEVVVAGGVEILARWRARDCLLGTLAAPSLP